MTNRLKCLMCILLVIFCIFENQTVLSQERKKGGEISIRLEDYPRSLNPYTYSETYCYFLGTFVLESLIDISDEDINLYLPRLAQSWNIADDIYTFRLYKEAKFFDGTPVTAEDVKFTLDTIYNPKYPLCQSFIDIIGPIDYVKVLDTQTVKIKMKEISFRNLSSLGTLYVLPKHIYGDPSKNFNQDFDKVMYGSGPYVLEVNANSSLFILKKNKNWWGGSILPYNKDRFNFDKITAKVIQDNGVAFEMFKKKELDVLYMCKEALYSNWDNTNLAPWNDPNCGRITAPLYYPHVWNGIALNMRKPPLNEKKFRKALQLLLDRQRHIRECFEDKTLPIPGPFAIGTSYSAGLTPTPFDPALASKLLKEIGYTQADSDGILYKEVCKDGKLEKQRASFELIYSLHEIKPWATIFKEDAKKVGVEINLKFEEWRKIIKEAHSFKFDAFVIGWNSGLYPVPEQLFSGKSAEREGSCNYTGFNLPEIDELIAKGAQEFDDKKRFEIYRRIETIIVDEQPYIFLTRAKEHMVGYWKDRIDPTDVPFKKYTGNDLDNPFLIRWYAMSK